MTEWQEGSGHLSRGLDLPLPLGTPDTASGCAGLLELLDTQARGVLWSLKACVDFWASEWSRGSGRQGQQGQPPVNLDLQTCTHMHMYIHIYIFLLLYLYLSKRIYIHTYIHMYATPQRANFVSLPVFRSLRLNRNVFLIKTLCLRKGETCKHRCANTGDFPTFLGANFPIIFRGEL